MFCIFCGSQTQVTNSRAKKKLPLVWRRRQCLECKAGFSTTEKPILSGSVKFKDKSGRLEPFCEDKLMLSIQNSLSHRKNALNEARGLAATTLSKILPKPDKIVVQQQLVQAAYRTLLRFDRAAATYYKAHHQTH